MNIEKLAIEHGAEIVEEKDFGNINKDGSHPVIRSICFENTEQLEAFAKAYASSLQSSEPVAYRHTHLIKQIDLIINKLGLTQEQAWTEGGALHAPRICNHIQETLDALSEANNKLGVLLGSKRPATVSLEKYNKLLDALRDLRRDTAGLYQDETVKSLINRLIDIRARIDEVIAEAEGN